MGRATSFQERCHSLSASQCVACRQCFQARSDRIRPSRSHAKETSILRSCMRAGRRELNIEVTCFHVLGLEAVLTGSPAGVRILHVCGSSSLRWIELNDWVNEGAVRQAFGTTTGSKTWPLREAVWRRTRWWPLASPKAHRLLALVLLIKFVPRWRVFSRIFHRRSAPVALGVPPCASRVVCPVP